MLRPPRATDRSALAPERAPGAPDAILWADLCAAASTANKGYRYDTSCVAQLLRLVRNTSDGRGGGHYDGLPAPLRARLEARPGGLAGLVLRRFPSLLLAASKFEQEVERG